MTDLERIKVLKKEIGWRLSERNFKTIMSSYQRGYATDKQHNVVGLNLNGLKFNQLPKSLFTFSHLEKLSLEGNKISDISGIEQFKNLTSLDLSGNLLSSFDGLEQLKNLTLLDLGSNLLSSIDGLGELKNLTELNLNRNLLRGLDGLGKLKNLTSLNLYGNLLSSLDWLEGLLQLTTLVLSYNQIKQLPETIVDLGMEIDVETVKFWEKDQGLFLYNNPIESPPLEILKKGRKAIKAYFKSLKDRDALPLNEVKVMLVGDGGAGKTSLVKRMQGKGFDENESTTHGININEWKLTDKENDRDITAHLWDFGGQQIMHATHQFFLSKRSLYILVLDGRKEEDPEYWLKHIQSFGGDSPVLVVINKIDQTPGSEVNRKFLLEKYKNIMGFFRVSCRTEVGVSAFIDTLQKALFQIEIIQTVWAANWFKVKERLEHMEEHCITRRDYLAICGDEGVTEKDAQETLVNFLNDLGVILHFPDLQLQDTHVLEPRWVTTAVYKIINSKEPAEHRGVLNLDCLEKILFKKGDYDFFYPPEQYNFIIELMKKFELCYALETGKNKGKLLIPDLLPKEEPEFDFDDETALKFIVQYDFLPKSIMPRFIVRRHKDIKSGLQWRTGVVLEEKSLGSTAVVRADERERRIYIHVNGERKREHFAIIRNTLDGIKASFEKLDATELVPLPGHETATVGYQNLIGHMRRNKTEIFVGELEQDFNVPRLLEALEKRDELIKRMEQYKSSIHFSPTIEFSPKIEVNPNMSQNTHQETTVETQVSTDIDIEINIDIKTEFPAFEDQFHELKELLETAAGTNPKLTGELAKIETDIDRVNPEAGKEELRSPFRKMRRFLNKLGDEGSEFNKVLKGVKTGLETAQKVGRTYNKFAQWLALPTVPDLFLGSQEKKKE